MLFFVILLLPPSSTLFPYTTLFRSLPRIGALQRIEEFGRSELEAGSSALRRGTPRGGRLARSTQQCALRAWEDRKSTRLNSSHANISYAVFCLKKKKLQLS